MMPNPTLKRTAAPPLSFALERSSGFDSVGRIGKILAQGSYHPCYFFPVKLSFA